MLIIVFLKASDKEGLVEGYASVDVPTTNIVNNYLS
jgi:hypothetical protein